MGQQGEDVKLSSKAREVFPCSIEAKATEAFNMREAWEQAVANAKSYQPVVVHRKNRTQPVAICDLDYFISLHADCNRLALKIEELQKLAKGIADAKAGRVSIRKVKE